MPSTPQFSWPLLNQRAGCEVWVKHENHNPTGAFKVRGGLVYLDDLKRRPAAQGPFPFAAPEPSFIQYQVNVFVDHSETKGAPVIMENNPTYPNLFGAVERRAQFGALVTDFTGGDQITILNSTIYGQGDGLTGGGPREDRSQRRREPANRPRHRRDRRGLHFRRRPHSFRPRG